MISLILLDMYDNALLTSNSLTYISYVLKICHSKMVQQCMQLYNIGQFYSLKPHRR